VTVSQPAPSDPKPSVAAYEQLRAGVLGGWTAGRPVGLALVLREGLASWLARGAVGPAALESAADPDRGATPPPISDEVHAELVRVLAGMALAGRHERTP
jgi:hypothetical protein